MRQRPAGYGPVPHETTLYERWRAVAQAHRDEPALYEPDRGRWQTFAELAAQADRVPATEEPVVFPQGADAEFLLTVLQGWRDGRPVCPIESGQPRPAGPWPTVPVVHLKTTSATAGEPRLVAFTAEQLAADAANLVVTMGLRPDWPNLGVISLAHSYGFSSLVTPLLLHGIPLILGGSALPEAVRRAAAAATSVTLPAVPALWRAWHDADAIPANVRLAISAGAPLPVALEREVFDARGLKLHNFYGASECGGIAYDRTNAPRADGALAGSPVENVSLRVREDGCLDISGPGVATGYWPATGPTLADGVYHASDLAAVRDGQVYLLGRAGDVINVAGRKVAPETVERALLEHPAVSEAVVLGLPAADGHGEVIAAAVVCQSGVGEGELRRFLLAQLPAWQVPRQWRLERASLANTRGKVSRTAMRQAWRTGAP